MLVYFMTIWSILLPYGIFCGHLVYFMVIWYICPLFGLLYQKQSGNPASQASCTLSRWTYPEEDGSIADSATSEATDLERLAVEAGRHGTRPDSRSAFGRSGTAAAAAAATTAARLTTAPRCGCGSPVVARDRCYLHVILKIVSPKSWIKIGECDWDFWNLERKKNRS
jgi:hypothetical protein